MAAPVSNESLFGSLASFLNSIGLGSLFSYSGGKPSGWLWEQIQKGVSTQDELSFALEQTPAFQQRFKVIFDMRDKAARGELSYVPTANDVLNYEREYAQTMSAAGVPSWFYDSVEDAHNAMRSNLSVTQIQERIDRGYGVIQEMPVEVKSAFEELYGGQAEGVLMAAVLDPGKTLREIDRSVRAAQVAGFGRRMGLGVTADQAQRFSAIDMSEAEIRAGVAEAARLRPLTEERIGEAALNLSDENALAAGLGTNAVDQQLFEARLATRRAGQSTVATGALTGATGVTGAGVV